MKFGYIRYGNMSPEFWEITAEQRKEKVAEIKKEMEKQGFKLVLWGHPYGTSENIVFVYKSEKGLDSLIEVGVPHPMGNTRTNIVQIP